MVVDSGLERSPGKDEEDRQARSNLGELISSAAEFDKEFSGTLAEYVQQVSLVSDTDRLEGAGGSVIALMTLHAAKGLVTPVVFIIGCEQGLLPFVHEPGESTGWSMVGPNPEGLEEERRLCFVGMTRAIDELTMTCRRRTDAARQDDLAGSLAIPHGNRPIRRRGGRPDAPDLRGCGLASRHRGGFYEDVAQREAIEAAQDHAGGVGERTFGEDDFGDDLPTNEPQLPPEYEHIRTGTPGHPHQYIRRYNPLRRCGQRHHQGQVDDQDRPANRHQADRNQRRESQGDTPKMPGSRLTTTSARRSSASWPTWLKEGDRMSILVDGGTKVIVQGITGRDGSFHARSMLAYGTKVVGGVTPGKGGQSLDAMPVFNSVAEAVSATGADASVIFVPAPFASAAIREAADSPLRLIVCITEGVPIVEMAQNYQYVKERGKILIGPELPRPNHAGRMQDRHHARPHPQTRARRASSPAAARSRTRPCGNSARAASGNPPASASAATRSRDSISSICWRCSRPTRKPKPSSSSARSAETPKKRRPSASSGPSRKSPSPVHRRGDGPAEKPDGARGRDHLGQPRHPRLQDQGFRRGGRARGGPPRPGTRSPAGLGCSTTISSCSRSCSPAAHRLSARLDVARSFDNRPEDYHRVYGGGNGRKALAETEASAEVADRSRVPGRERPGLSAEQGRQPPLGLSRRRLPVRATSILSANPIPRSSPRCIEVQEKSYHRLSLGEFGLSEEDLDRVYFAGGGLRASMPLSDILERFRGIYCGYIGVEFLHIQNKDMREWLISRMEDPAYATGPDAAQRRTLLEDLVKAEELERFLQRTFIGQKRFSLEGSEAVIPALHYVLDGASPRGIERIVMGAAHRGRLTILALIVGKPLEELFYLFEEGFTPGVFGGSDDVKYHIGYSLHPCERGRHLGCDFAVAQREPPRVGRAYRRGPGPRRPGPPGRCVANRRSGLATQTGPARRHPRRRGPRGPGRRGRDLQYVPARGLRHGRQRSIS